MDTATISGRVLDSSGASVAFARVELQDTDRDSKTVVVTNSIGFYLFAVVRPGHYRIRVSAPGFRTVDLNRLTIYTQDNIQELFVLAFGSQLDSVTLNAAGVHIATSGAVGTVIDPSLISNLPLNGLSFQKLFQLTPGVVTAATSFATQGQFSTNGQRTNANYFVVDGVAANVGIAAGIEPGQSAVGSLPALTAFGGTNGLISTEDVQEFAILTSSYAAEFGHAPGAQVSIVSRAGTSAPHGTLFEYLRNDALDANDWFVNRLALPRAALRQNDFGGVLGGPLPKKGTFFFASAEGLELRQPSSANDLVPSQFARNSAPPVLKPFFDAYPLSTGPDIGNGLAQAVYSFSNPSHLDSESFRIDQRTEAVTAFARYVHSSSSIRQRGAESNALSTVTNTRFSLQTITAGVNVQASSRVIEDFRFNWSRTSAASNERLDSFGGAVPLSSQLLFPIGFTPVNGFFQFVPALDPRQLTLAVGKNVINIQNQLNFLDNLSFEAGTHLLKAGIDVRALRPNLQPAAYEQQVLFSDLQAALMARPLLSSIVANVPVRGSVLNYSAYVEDSWRPSARLNVEYGVRWEFAPAPGVIGANGLHSVALQGIDSLASLSVKPGSPLYHSRWNNFAPRIGIAYAIRRSQNSACVIKLGYGIFFDLSNGPAGNAMSAPFFPFTAEKFVVGSSFPLSSTDASPPLFSKPPFTVQGFPAVLRTPYSYQWNLSIEQALGTSQTLSVSAIGAIGHGLLNTQQYIGGEAGVPLAFTELLFTDNSGYSHYRSLQAKFQRRAGQSIQLIAAYSYARSLDDVSTDAISKGIPTRFVNAARDYGPSDFDIRHTARIGLKYALQIKSSIHLLKRIISAWSLDSMFLAQSSPPVDVTISRDIGFGVYHFRPDLVEGLPLYTHDANAPGGRIINSAALSIPTAPRQGTLARNSFRGFPLFQDDFAVAKDFRIGENLSLQARIEAFNIFNHPNFAPPLGMFGTLDPAGHFVPQNGFGVAQSMLAQGLQTGSFGTGFSPLYQVGAARTMQLAVKIKF